MSGAVIRVALVDQDFKVLVQPTIFSPPTEDSPAWAFWHQVAEFFWFGFDKQNPDLLSVYEDVQEESKRLGVTCDVEYSQLAHKMYFYKTSKRKFGVSVEADHLEPIGLYKPTGTPSKETGIFVMRWMARSTASSEGVRSMNLDAIKACRDYVDWLRQREDDDHEEEEEEQEREDAAGGGSASV